MCCTLFEAQRLALDILIAWNGSQSNRSDPGPGPEVLHARLEAFMRYETTLLGQIHDHVASDISTCCIPVSDEEPRTRPLIVNDQTSEEKRRKKRLLWIQEVKLAMSAATRRSEQRFGMITYNIGERAKEWTLTCTVSVETTFSTRDSLKR